MQPDEARSAATAGGAAPRGPSIDGRPLEDRTAAYGTIVLHDEHLRRAARVLSRSEDRRPQWSQDDVAWFAEQRKDDDDPA